MPRSFGRYFLPLVALSALSLAAGCGSPWKQELIYNGGNDGVFLYAEHREDEEEAVTPLGHSHPYEVEPSRLAFLLERLSYEHKPLFGSSGETRVFTSDQVRDLTEPMARALADLSADQRLRFLVIQPSIGKILVGLTGTAGVAFRRGEEFHLAFDTIDEGINDGDGGRPENVVFSEDPTDEEYTYGLALPFPGARVKQDRESGRVFKRWLVIPESDWIAAQERASREVEIAAKKTLKDTVSPPPGENPDAGDGNSPVAEEENDKLDEAERAKLDKTANRLERLEYLKERGAITQEQYEKQVQAILDEL